MALAIKPEACSSSLFWLLGHSEERLAMLESVLSNIPLEALAARMSATAFVAIVVSWAVGRFGPAIGGTLAGLPIILGPGFYFLITQATKTFIMQAAAYALLSLCATQLFLLTYIATARKGLPWVSLACAMITWLLAVLLLQLFPAQPIVGVLLFILTTMLCLSLSRRFTMLEASVEGKAGIGLLLARSILAGSLVAVVTSASAWLGSAGAGLLLAFPIGYTVVAVTIHQTFGSASIIVTLQSALKGTASLAGFCAVLAVAVLHWTAPVAFGAALATSVLITLCLILRRQSVVIKR